ncbi:precorrin-3B C(17)-methyltransferase [Burkholderia sp. FERM BP-3421]|uniref:precorrin-3B C(17)-methyltransferase n=1 Tax=Burkholderia sp. FERM BP-3421 TaxID=1494466 RepID=UPI002360A4DD|nr:precorrin-3B C(17)-methyltransferase [Burkholderia sp. FERM BP-3421]WDD94185.1 precorrin-3B C(17)-methyltransferase [Burkholderia sp. FERM BP-3421]
MTTAPAIIVLGPGALDVARRIQAGQPGAQVHALASRARADVAFDELGAHLRDLYRRGTPIVALCAAGIVIRCIAPLLADKGAEPPVLAVAEDGSTVVPLLGGLAGVNTLARAIAATLACAPAITTSGELRFGACLLNPPDGYTLADLDHGKRFVSDLLAGETVRIDGAAPWLDAVALPRDDAGATRTIQISPRAHARADTLLIHPRSVVVALTLETRAARADGRAPQCGAGDGAGFGAEAEAEAEAGAEVGTEAGVGTKVEVEVEVEAEVEVGAGVGYGVGARAEAGIGTETETRTRAHAEAESLAQQVRAALTEAGLASHALAALVAPASALGHPALAQAAGQLGVPLRFATGAAHDAPALLADTLATIAPDCTPAAGATPTLAIAVCARPVPVERLGRARGRLTVLGLGPGSAALLTPAARAALDDATDILGYATYVEMAGPFHAGQRLHPTDNREEMQRARHAFALAAQGRRVAMVSSGDPGVFAMAAAVLEALDAAAGAPAAGAPAMGDPAWATVELEIIPGVSAALATAAVAGAPLGHDFCMLSLSDNLKPWDIIETRLRHAAQADLVMAFYNPISRARPWQLDRALDTVRAWRAPDTVVVLGRDIGRPGATLVTTTLGALRADQVDMRTMVIVGSSTTRRVSLNNGRDWVYTPRWYR